MSAKARIAVFGYGNPLRGEDGVGPAVVRRLVGCLPRGVELRELAADGLSLLMAWQAFDYVVVVDAVVSGADPGTIHHWSADRLPPTEQARLGSTHGLGLRDAIELGRSLSLLPDQLLVLGIEARHFDLADAIGPEVAGGIEAAAEIVRLTVESWADEGRLVSATCLGGMNHDS